MKFSYSLIKKFLTKAPPKTKLADALNMRSFETENLAGDLLEISLPPNRYSDAASHLGIAREVSTIFGLKLENLIPAIVNPPSNKGLLEVKIENRNLCPRYAARYFEIKKISQSPLWIQKSLKACGLKPINNVVDLMNYVMLETGQPLHAFDADKLKGTKKKTKNFILIRKAKKGEKIETLDGQKFTLDSGILVIADAERPLAIAGIKGGQNSGVSRRTKRIIVEAANFDPVTIFKGSRRLNLPTDAALRFSHGISPALVDFGLDRATLLLKKAGAKLVDSVDIYPRPIGEELIEFKLDKYRDLIGADVSLTKAKRIFGGLGFIVEPKKATTSSFMVRIPEWRTDIEDFEDLAEEVARLTDYNALRPQAPLVSIKPAHEEDAVIFKDKVRRILTNLQLDEVYNPSFLGEDELKNSHEFRSVFGKTVLVENPIAEDKKYLRPSLAPLLLKNIKDNSRFLEQIRIFEIGKIFYEKRGVPGEKLSLGIALAAKKEPRLILEIKGLADELLKGLGVSDYSIIHQGEGLRAESGNQVLGIMRLAHLEKNWVAAVGEFDLDKVLGLTEEEKEFVPLKKFPAIMRDISILVGREVRIGEILEAIQAASPKLIENVDLIDEYIDERFGGKQSLTFRIVFQAEDRTLTDDEVNMEIKKITLALAKKFRAKVR